MDHRHRHARGLVALVIAAGALLFAAFAALAQTGTELVTYNWTQPTTGTPVVNYIVEHSVNGGTWVRVGTVATNSYDLVASVAESHQIRVAGVDAAGAQGLWSPPSDPYTPDPGFPGQPGKPVKNP